MFHYLQFLFCEDLGNFAARVELGREPAWKPRVNFHNVNVWLTNFLSCLIRRIGDTTLQPIESHPATEVVESDAEEPGQAEEEPDAPAETSFGKGIACSPDQPSCTSCYTQHWRRRRLDWSYCEQFDPQAVLHAICSVRQKPKDPQLP